MIRVIFSEPITYVYFTSVFTTPITLPLIINSLRTDVTAYVTGITPPYGWMHATLRSHPRLFQK